MRYLFCLIAVVATNLVNGQVIKKGTDEIPVTSAVPFLRIPVDARSAGMADIGVATSADNNSDYHNPSKFSFIEGDYGVSINYSPWLRQLVNDIHLISLNGYYKIDKMQTIAGGLRYFSLGQIDFTDAQGNPLGNYRPNELAFDVHYARKMSKKFGIGVSLRYIYSNLTGGFSPNSTTGAKAGNAVAGDISMFYTTNVKLGGTMKSHLNWGLNISNIGNKMNYTSQTAGDYLPANFATGVSYGLDIDQYNTVNFNFEINKLMVPTPDTVDADPRDGTPDYKAKGTISSIFSSWGDAPKGMSEELKEYIMQFGVEYWYNKMFAVRAGYFYETDAKGGRNFLTAGVGLKYSSFMINFSYLIPTSSTRNPLDNTMRFSLLFNFKKEKKVPAADPAPETKDKAIFKSEAPTMKTPEDASKSSEGSTPDVVTPKVETAPPAEAPAEPKN